MPVATFRPVGSINGTYFWGHNSTSLHEAIDEVVASIGDRINTSGDSGNTCRIEFDFASVLSSSDTINSVKVYYYCFADKAIFRTGHNDSTVGPYSFLVLSSQGSSYSNEVVEITTNETGGSWTANDLINTPYIGLYGTADGPGSYIVVAQMYVEVDYTGGTPPPVEEDDAIFFGND
jgi:hypothetical protein